MKLFDDWKFQILYWASYLFTILSLWYHTYQIFLISDPPIIAAGSAAAIDGMLALTLIAVGRAYGRTQNVAIAGVVMFALLSGGAQLVYKNLYNPAVPWVNDIAQFLLPISGVVALLVLGFIKLFDQNRDGVPDFMQRGGKGKGQSQQNFRGHSNPPRIPPPPPVKPREMDDEMDKWLREPRGHMNGQPNGHSTEKVTIHDNTVAAGPRLVDKHFPTRPRSESH
jgi:hypothetical protein